MKIFRLLFIAGLLTCFCISSWALKGDLATETDIVQLKEDILLGKIHLGKTRLMKIQEKYGEAPNIINDDQRITYDYTDLKIVFDKKRVWKRWEYDSFKKPAYTDDVDNLRYDLESEELVGKNITFSKILKDYDDPTESFQTEEDGEMSIYYYGDIKLTFENQFVVQSWRGSNLSKVLDAGTDGKTAVLSNTEAREGN